MIPIKMSKKNKTSLLLVALILLLAGSGVACVKYFGQKGETSPSPSGSPSASLTPSGTPITKNNIILESPLPGNMVNFPFTIRGQGRVFENMVSLRVKDAAGQLLYSGSVYANAPDVGQFGSFEKEINYFFKTPKSQNLTVEVFWSSPMDGSDMDVVSSSVELNPNESSTSLIKVYFGNSKLDPEISCNKVFAVDRVIPKTQSVARKALEVLLEGVSQAEYEAGYYTSLNSGIKINSINIEGDTAKADFNEMLEQGVGGSCKVTAIRAQINETLKQFPTIKNAVISIGGRTEDILQP